MKKFLFTIIVLLILGGVADYTNPTKKDHLAKMNESLTEAVSQKLGEKGKFASVLGGMFTNTFGTSVLNAMVEYKDYGVFSVCTMKQDDDERIVSIGAFGKTITFDSDDLLDAYEDSKQ